MKKSLISVRFLLWLFLWLHAFTYTYAQRVCATSKANTALQPHTHYPITPFKNAFRIENSSTDTLLIPVIVHVVHSGKAIGVGENISAEQVYSQLAVLNEDFQRKGSGSNTHPAGAGLAIKFMPAIIDTLGQTLPEPGIHRVVTTVATWNSVEYIDTHLKPATQFNPNKYLNIWVVTLGGALSGTLGYAQFPNQSGLSGFENLNNNPGISKTDGIVIRYNVFGRVGNLRAPYNKGRSTTHEMGHFFGLFHVWGRAGDDDPNCVDDDLCDDTPQTSGPINFCPTNPLSCVTTITAMKENYMDYSDDGCMNTFTQEQAARMLTVLQNSPRRKQLTSSTVYTTSSPIVAFGASKTAVCIGDTVQFFDSTKISINYTRFWNIKEASSATNVITSTSVNPKIRFNSPGTYHASLTVKAVSGFSETVTRDSYISVQPTLGLSTSFPGVGFQCGKELFLIPSGAFSYNLLVNGAFYASITGGFFSYVPTTTTQFIIEGFSETGCKAIRTLNLTLNNSCEINIDDPDDSTLTALPVPYANTIKIFPNPFTHLFTVESAKKISKVDVYTHSGRKIYTKTPDTTALVIPMQGFADGLYYIVVYDQFGKAGYKLVKQ